MQTIDVKAPVLVTGATGYVAGELVKLLVERGHTVHAAVRDPSSSAKLAHLEDLAKKGPGTIRYFKADLLAEGSYGEAMRACELVFHTASPFSLDVKNAQNELIEPAVSGTRNVLEEANRTSSVKRVVVTSSCAAVYGDNLDTAASPKGILDESDWNTTTSAEYLPYSYSKVLAEKEAWSISEQQDRWDLVTVNPSMVMGPALNPKAATSESLHLMKQFGDGTLKMGVPDLGLGIVDVRDVAEAHYRAGYHPEAKGRYIASGREATFPEIARILRAKFDGYPLPKRTTPKWLVWLIGPLVSKGVTRRYLSRNVGHPLRLDHGKSERELGMTYRPLEQTLTDMFQQLIDVGMLPKSSTR